MLKYKNQIFILNIKFYLLLHMNQIYLLHEKTRSNFKIGSTCNFANRIGGYITCCDYFDSTTHYIELYDITESKYNCYQLDWVKYYHALMGTITLFRCLSERQKINLIYFLGRPRFHRKRCNIDEFKKQNNITHIDYVNVVIITLIFFIVVKILK